MAKTITSEMERINRKNAKHQKGKEKKYSFAADAWKRFKRNRTALVGLAIIVLYLSS